MKLHWSLASFHGPSIAMSLPFRARKSAMVEHLFDAYGRPSAPADEIRRCGTAPLRIGISV